MVVGATLLRADPAHPGGVAVRRESCTLISKLDIDGRVAIAIYNNTESHVVSEELKVIEKQLKLIYSGLRNWLWTEVNSVSLSLKFKSDLLSGFRWRNYSSPCVEKRLPNMNV